MQGVLLSACCALLVLLAGVVTLTLHSEYQREVSEIVSDSSRTAQKLAFRTGEVFDRVDQTTLLVKYLTGRGQLPSLQQLRMGGVLANDVTRVVLVTDAKGFVTDSTSDLVALNLADEDDFKAHKRRQDLEITIAAAAPNPLAGGHVIAVSRRLGGAFDQFAGIVTATVDPETLTAEYGKSEAADTAVGVLGLDGIFRSRQAGGKVTFGEKIDVASLQRRAAETLVDKRPARSPIDGVERFVTTVRVDRYPLIAVVAVNAQTALAGYRHTRDVVLGGAAATAALVLVSYLLLRQRMGALEVSRKQTRRAEAAMRAALEGSLDAVAFMSAERDAGGALIDLVITDSNERAAALLGKTRSQVLGQRLCTLAPNIRGEGHLIRFERSIRSGRSSAAEVEATDPHSKGRWLHHQVVPVEDGIALFTRDVSERRKADQALAALALVDPLTGLGNRRDFERRLEHARARAQRSGETLGLVFIDLDGFKRVNDTHGHAVGDELLVAVARRLSASVRSTDAAHRLGGDEFTLILEAAGTQKDVADLCKRIVELLSRPYDLAAVTVQCTASAGVALLAAQETLATFQHRADVAMYRAKQAGKSRYRFSRDLKEAEVEA